MAGNDDDLCLRLNLLDFLQKFETVQVAHNDIGEDDRVGLLAEQLQPLFAIGGDCHVMTIVREYLGKDDPQGLFIINYENSASL